jgi:uncharacterized protein (TIGR02646 family)
MIAVKRIKKPESLEKKALIWTDKYQKARTALAAQPNSEALKKAKKQAESQYSQPDIKKALNEMFHNKCGFCEVSREYPQIEHFKPKDVFPESCFEWNNLISACEVCNGAAYKGTKFPLDEAGNALFINPCEDDPNEHIDFVCEQDEAAESGFIAILKAKTPKGKATIEELGLNRLVLLRERSQHVAPYYLILALNAKNGDVQAKALLEKVCQANYVFAAFMRTLKAVIVK